MSKCGCGTETDRHSSWCPRLDLEKADEFNGYAVPLPAAMDLSTEDIAEWYTNHGYPERAEWIRRFDEQT